MSRQLLIIIIFCFCSTISVRSYHCGGDLAPTIQVVIPIHPYNKLLYLPHTLGALESQDYPKDRIRVYLITERVFYDVTSEGSLIDHDQNGLILDDRIRANDQTIEMLKKWSKANREVYNEVELSISNVHLSESTDYWTKYRYRHLIDLKNQALVEAVRSWADWLVFTDPDVIWTDTKLFSNFTSIAIQDLVVVAPMMQSFGTYSNFWAGMDEKGYYVRTDEYLPILERKQRGSFSVPMVHSCVFINLRMAQSKLLTFDPLDLFSQGELTIPYDDIIAFAKSAARLNVKLYVNNMHIWGFLPTPITQEESLDESKQILLDLELESMVEGKEFVVSSVLDQYVEGPNSYDSLGVDRIYVINLERRLERKTRMAKTLKKLGVKFRFLHATDGRSLSEEFLAKSGIKTLEGYVDPYHKRAITFGEIGCFLSHFRIWKEMEKDQLEMVLVLEDDVRFDRNFRFQWFRYLSRFRSISNQYDFLYLGRKLNGDYTKEEVIEGGAFVKPGYSYWTIGYLITRQGVRKLLATDPTSRMLPVDEFLPLMYGSHPNLTLREIFGEFETLNALSLRHLIIQPTHYVGNPNYVSDTEDSNHVEHPKNLEPVVENDEYQVPEETPVASKVGESKAKEASEGPLPPPPPPTFHLEL